jgi:hypothetical protein
MSSKAARFVAGLAFLLVIAAGWVTVRAAEKPEWRFHSIVDESFVRLYAVVPQPKGVMIVDSRAYKPKFVNGHIPAAVSIPDSQFEEQKGKLPEDKSTLLIFYCEGPT